MILEATQAEPAIAGNGEIDLDAILDAGVAAFNASAPEGVTAESSPSPLEDESSRLEKVIAETSLEISRLKARAKSLKKMLDGYTEEYDAISLRLDDGDTDAGGDNAEAAGDLLAATADAPAATAVPSIDLAADPEAWRAVTCEALGIAPGIRKLLEENAGITTLGGMADWTGGGKQLSEIRGIGDGKVEKIADACERFWAANALPAAAAAAE